jgi:GNAT superfamily N-acetyltransferase
MLIRPIEDQDVEPGIDIIRTMLEEGTEYQGVLFDEAVVRGWLRAAIEKPDDYFGVALMSEEGKPVGGMLGCRGNFTFSKQYMAIEVGLYILPEYRGSSAAVRLIKTFETWARDRGCVMIQSGVTIGINNDLAAGIYRKLGYRDAGPMLRKEL